MFLIQDKPLDLTQLKEDFPSQESGACLTFEGIVRKKSMNKEVLYLEYEAYEDLAQKEALLIFTEALQKFKIIDVRAGHRIGRLQVGDLALWVSVASFHRKEGFNAVEYIVNQIKARLPIWKKELFVDGSSHWVDCRGCKEHMRKSVTEEDYYNRQIVLPQIGDSGQEELKKSSVLVVGAGGLGCPALSGLAGAGVGHITICDGDQVQSSNLHRQFLFSPLDIGKNKAEIASKALRKLNPLIQVEAYESYFNESNSKELLEGKSLVLDCMDNFESKFFLHEVCRAQKIPLIQASLYRFEGQMHLFTHKEEEACLRCIWPKTPESVDTCVEAGILGAIAGVFGNMQAIEGLKLLLSQEDLLCNEMLHMNLESWELSKFKKKKNRNCPLCSSLKKENEEITELTEENFDLSYQELKSFENFEFIDIRELAEVNMNNFWERDLKRVQVSALDKLSLSDQSVYILLCSKGVRSKTAAKKLRLKGFKQFFSLKGGLSSLEGKQKHLNLSGSC
jgi:sulfur-carrier protein adenylyltransferase/sulfurtransferase